MDTTTERKQRLIELFPEAHLNGELNIDKLCSSLGVRAPAAPGVALTLNAETLHSLRNCAAVIQSSARLLQRRSPAPAAGAAVTGVTETAEIIESLINASERMRQLLQT